MKCMLGDQTSQLSVNMKSISTEIVRLETQSSFLLNTHAMNNECNIDVRALNSICSFDGFYFYDVHS